MPSGVLHRTGNRLKIVEKHINYCKYIKTVLPILILTFHNNKYKTHSLNGPATFPKH
jgi:hypothetical protein